MSAQKSMFRICVHFEKLLFRYSLNWTALVTKIDYRAVVEEET